VSSLATGRDGWAQRTNFKRMAFTASRLVALRSARGEPRTPSLVPVVTFGAGVGLIGSGMFVTDPVAGFPRLDRARDGSLGVSRSAAPTLGGQLHNVCAIPIFVGIPAAALVSAGSAARRGECRSAGYRAGSAVGMAGTCVLFGAAFAAGPPAGRHGGVFQRISIATALGWLTALASRALRASALGSVAPAPSRPVRSARCAFRWPQPISDRKEHVAAHAVAHAHPSRTTRKARTSSTLATVLTSLSSFRFRTIRAVLDVASRGTGASTKCGSRPASRACRQIQGSTHRPTAPWIRPAHRSPEPELDDDTVPGRQLFADKLLTQHGANQGACNSKCVRRRFPYQTEAQEKLAFAGRSITGRDSNPRPSGYEAAQGV
jgi:Protein of unknown function (DUF998)